MRTVVCALVVLSVLGAAQVTGQTPTSTWLNPPDEQILAAAKRGFEGFDIGLLRLYFKKDRFCQGYIAGILLETPLRAAEQVGRTRRVNSEPLPTAGDLSSVKRRATFYVSYGSMNDSDEVEGVMVKQERRVYRASSIEQLRPQAISCDAGSWKTVYWRHSAVVNFRGADALPTKGKGSLVVRRANRPPEVIDLNFSDVR